MSKLRIGVLMDSSFLIQSWEYCILQKMSEMDYAEWCVTLIHDTVPKKERSFHTFFYRLYQQYEDKKYPTYPNAMALQDAGKLHDTIPVLKYESDDNFDMSRLQELHLDVIIRLGEFYDSGKLARTTRHGVWFIKHGEFGTSGPIGFWEVMQKQQTLKSAICIQKEDTVELIKSSHSSIDAFSINLSRNRSLWKSVEFIPRCLRTLNSKNSELEGETGSKVTVGEGFRYPRNSEVFTLLIKHVCKLLKLKYYKSFYLEQWILLFGFSEELSFNKYQKLLPPKDRFWADPFAVQKDGKYYIFIEEALFANKKGFISYLTIDEAGNFQQPKKIIEKPYHMSYPFVFNWQNEYYMIPETSANNTIELYKCRQFPDQWEFQTNLMEQIEAFDATLLEHEGRWWLFANVRENRGASSWDELYLYYADSPISTNWTPHPENPIVSDVRSARPAGKLFKRDDSIYRPSQNSINRYGFGIKINKVIKLNELEYQEQEVNSFEPDWDSRMLGIHTYNVASKLNISDGIYQRSQFHTA